jgi:hypothetical protein
MHTHAYTHTHTHTHTPAYSYYHGRTRRGGYNVAAVTRGGALYTWGGCNHLVEVVTTITLLTLTTTTIRMSLTTQMFE